MDPGMATNDEVKRRGGKVGSVVRPTECAATD